MVAHTTDTGVYLPGDRPWFTTAYFHDPDEPAAEARTAGLLAVLRRVETEPCLLGASSHLLTAASNPG
jgi:hypothetical protein